MNFLSQGFHKLEHYEQTDRQTDRHDRTHYHTALAGSNETRSTVSDVMLCCAVVRRRDGNAVVPIDNNGK